MKVIIEVDLSSDLVQSAYAVGDVVTKSLLRDASNAVDSLAVGDNGIVRDRNGEPVGQWAVVDTPVAIWCESS